MVSQTSTAGVEHDLTRNVQELERQLSEAHQREAATADVLKAISRSPSDLQEVLDALTASAARLCQADFALIRRREGDAYPEAASTGLSPEQRDLDVRRRVDRGSIYGRAILDGRTVHIPNVALDPEWHRPESSAIGTQAGIGVPLVRDGTVMGVLTLLRTRPQPFTKKQIELVETFADQAVIAIENTRLFEEVQARTRELEESLEYQTATSEVLNVISHSPTNAQPVFDAIVQSAARLCEAVFSVVWLYDGELLHCAASHNFTPEVLDHVRKTYPKRPDRSVAAGRAILDCRISHVPDTLADPAYARQLALAGNWRASLSVPMLRDGKPVGALSLGKAEAVPFSERQVQLLTTFANQAVIAIENARLFEEVQTRTSELAVSLEHQTATSDVLGAIARSPNDLRPVLETLAETALRLCESYDVTVFLRKDDWLHLRVLRGPVGSENNQDTFPVARGYVMGSAVLNCRVVHVPDLRAAQSEFPEGYAASVKLGHRTILAVPLMRRGDATGVIVLRRFEIKPFSDKQIALLKNFADQAVIAIENTRLFEEVQASNRELRLALEQQTATSELLKVIGRFTFDLQPVFETLIESAVKLCGATRGFVARFDGELLRFAAGCNVTPDLRAYFEQNPFPVDRHSNTGRAALERRTIHNVDVRADPEYTYGGHQVDPYRTVLAIPMLKAEELLGVILIYRHEVLPFSDSQIALMETFADQAVIAIENTRLFEEVQARTRELTRSVEELRSLGEIGQTVSASLELSEVLQTVVEQASIMSYATGGAVYVFDRTSGEFHLEAGHNMSEEHIVRVRSQPIRMGDPVVGESGERRKAVQIADLREAPSSPLLDILLRTGVRAILAVPLMHQGEVTGALVVRRNHPGAFSDEIIHLLEAFAAQSAIAVYNARLFKEIARKSRELEIASQHKSQFVANMSHELRTPLAAILGYAELMQEGFYEPQGQKSLDALTRIRSNGKHLLGLINTVLDIAKIESGQFSLNLGEYAIESVVETVRAATESLAETKKLALKTDVARPLAVGFGDEQRLTQVLLNLVGNAIKFTDIGEVSVTASAVNNHFTVSVTDTGPGIPADQLTRVFEQFHQVDSSNTKAKGGTGLGLAISKQIVEMHGGRIWVESTRGRGSTFRVELPVRAEFRKVTA